MSKSTAITRLENMIEFAEGCAKESERPSQNRELHLRAGLAYGHALDIVRQEIPDEDSE